jgi:dephospho-CoA kinase
MSNKFTKQFYIIGVTGNICSGKSSAAKFLSSQKHGNYLNLDKFGHTIYQKNFFILNSIKKHFQNNPDIFTQPNTLMETINRKELGKVVFKDKSKLDLLNSLILPEIQTLLRMYITQLNAKETKPFVLYIEGAIIGENKTGYYPFDEVWLTKASREEVERRFRERLANENIKEYNLKTLDLILEKQMSNEEKSKYCDEVIDTSNDFEVTKMKYLELHNKVLNKLKLA